jgi:hypothetical protein
MTVHSLNRLDHTALIDEFAAAAKALGEAINYWLPEKKQNERLLAITDEIRFRGKTAWLLLVPLLDSNERFIQYYAARQLLSIVPDRSRQIIENNAKQGDAIAGDAGMLLYALDSGIYKPD